MHCAIDPNNGCHADRAQVLLGQERQAHRVPTCASQKALIRASDPGGARFHRPASPFRKVLATQLATSFGPEVAQLVMHDTLSTSLGPAYYSWVPEGAVMSRVAGLLTCH